MARSEEGRNQYEQMAEQYVTLAEVDENSAAELKMTSQEKARPQIEATLKQIQRHIT